MPKMQKSETIDRMLEALGLEIAAIKKDTFSSNLEILGGQRQQTMGSQTFYVFNLSEDVKIRDDSPVVVRVSQKEIDGTIVSFNNGAITIALEEDVGPQVAIACLVIDESFLVDRLRKKLSDINEGELSVNTKLADGLLSNKAAAAKEEDVPPAILSTGNLLNDQQKRVVALSLGSKYVFVWGPPGTGKTMTLAAVVHALYLQKKTVLIVSNTNIAVDTVVERIGDRLATLPDFHKAVVLRYGPIVSDTLKDKYGSEVDLDQVVKKHTKEMTEDLSVHKKKEDELAANATEYEKVLRSHKDYHKVNGLVEKLKEKLDKLVADERSSTSRLQQLEVQRKALASKLREASNSGAIMRFISGLNVEQLEKDVQENDIEITSYKESIVKIKEQIGACNVQITTNAQKRTKLNRKLERLPAEAESKKDLKKTNKKLSELREKIMALEEKINAVKSDLMKNCRVLATTIYQSYLKDDVAKEYDVVIVDEASMLALPMVYYVAALAKQTVVVAGDFRQLPPIVRSAEKEEVSRTWLKRDIFYCAGIADAVARKKYPKNLVALEEQYRMREDICGVINHFFYDNHLKTVEAPLAPLDIPIPFSDSTPGLLIIDTSQWSPWAHYKLGGWSRYNIFHALLITNIARKLQAKGFLGSGEINDRLGIVSPYGAQSQLIAQLVGEALEVRGSLYSATVHRFQGCERDVMLFDLTDSTGSHLGKFLKSTELKEDGARLLNVALSRARRHCVLIGNLKYLRRQLKKDMILYDILGYFNKHGDKLDISDCVPENADDIIHATNAVSHAPVDLSHDEFEAFTAETFFDAFKKDIKEAKREIVIFSPYMTSRGTARWVDLLRAKVKKRVKVRFVTRPPGDQGGVLEEGLADLCDDLRKTGIVVDQRLRLHEKIAFIDQQILWHGSLNILSHRDTTESMLRLVSSAACERVGRFVTTRRGSDDSKMELAIAENPTCDHCKKPMVWKNERFGVYYACECGHQADRNGRPQGKQVSKGARTGSTSSRRKTVKKKNVPSSTKKAKRSKKKDVQSNLGICPECGEGLKVRNGPRGKFIGCDGYWNSPQCRYTK